MPLMYATHGELEWALEDVKRHIPRLIQDHPARDEFWAVFRAYIDPILADAAPDDVLFARNDIVAMLAAHDLTIDWTG